MTSLIDLKAVPVPPQTDTYTPLPHDEAARQVEKAVEIYLGPQGFVTEEHEFHLWRDGQVAQGFSALDLGNSEFRGGVHWVNSYNKSKAFSVVSYLEIKVCSNGMFAIVAQSKRSRRHTSGLLEDIDPMIIEAIQVAPDVYSAAMGASDDLKREPVDNMYAHDFITQAYLRGVLTRSQLPVAVDHWTNPPFDQFNERNAWSLVNSVSYPMRRNHPKTMAKAHKDLAQMTSEFFDV